MNACLADTGTLDFGPPRESALSWPLARSLARDLITRRTAEGIAIYEQRLHRATDTLLSAAITAGNPLHGYLTRLRAFTAPRDRAGALTDAARAALRRANQ